MKLISKWLKQLMGKLSSIFSSGSSGGGGGSGSGATPAEAAQIAQNTTDIAVNATAAANAATDASNAAAAAATNATAIAANVTAISSNDTDIADNAADIMTNATAIAANATAAANAATAAASAASAAAQNATDIAANAASITSNTEMRTYTDDAQRDTFFTAPNENDWTLNQQRGAFQRYNGTSWSTPMPMNALMTLSSSDHVDQATVTPSVITARYVIELDAVANTNILAQSWSGNATIMFELVNSNTSADRTFTFASGDYFTRTGQEIGKVTLKPGTRRHYVFWSTDGNLYAMDGITAPLRGRTPVTGAYTISADDFASDGEAYLPLGGAITVGSGAATTDNLYRVLYIRNTSGSDTTVAEASGVTISGLKTIGANETLALVVTGANTLDATGGK